MGKRIALYLIFGFVSFSLIGCASVGPSVIKTYDNNRERSQMAILRTKPRMGLTVIGCDGLTVYGNTNYILLQPGRHEIWFSISGQNLLIAYNMTNKKYLDAVGGHTYILKSKGTGFFAIGNKWFPEVVDVTNDSKLHVENVPEESGVQR